MMLIGKIIASSPADLTARQLLHEAFAFATCAVAGLTVGLLALRWARRGHRKGDHPHCRACGYDLFGIDPRSTRCPECGEDLAKRRAIVIGQVKVHLIGLAIALLVLVGSGLIGYKTARMMRWAFSQKENQPVWWLCQEIKGKAHQNALWEMQHRLEQRELSSSQIEAIATTILDMREQSHPNYANDFEFHGVIPMMHEKGCLADRIWRRYARGCVQYYRYGCRSTVREGESLPFRFDFSPSSDLSRGTKLSYTYHLKRIEVDGRPLALQNSDLADLKTTKPEGIVGYPLLTEVRFITPSMLAPLKLQLGQHTFTAVVDVASYDGLAPPAGSPPLTVCELSTPRNWSLVPSDADTVALAKPKDADHSMDGRFARLRIMARHDNDHGAYVVVYLEVEPYNRKYYPDPFALSIHLRSGERHWQGHRI